MDFGLSFLIQTIVSVLFLAVFVALPGGLLLSFLHDRHLSAVDVLMAPVTGCCLVGPVTLLTASLLGYTHVVVLGTWFLILLITALLSRHPGTADTDDAPIIGWGWMLLIFFAAALWAVLPTFPAYPVVKDGGLYVNTQIFDHIKMAFSDSMVRNGLPPVNPFYAPNGEPIPLNYFYLWQFMVAHVCLLTGVSSWSAEMGMTWFTAFAGLSLLSGLAVKISGRPVAGLFVPVLALADSALSAVDLLLGPRVQRFLYLPEQVHGLEPLWMQISWAAQHVYSAFAVVLLLYILALLLAGRIRWWRAAVGLAVCSASALCTSIWIGGVALALTAPVLLLVLMAWRLRVRIWFKLLGAALVSAPLCVVLAWPVLNVIVGEGGADGGSPLAVRYFFAELIASCPAWQQMIHYGYFWLVYLPLVFGAAYVLGFFSLVALKTESGWTRLFKGFSLVFIVTYLLIVEFVRSVIMNNDLGWRTVMVPIILLLVWAAAGMARTIGSGVLSRWRSAALFVAGGFWMLGVLWTVCLLIHHKQCISASPEEQEMRRDFLAHKAAWDKLKELTSPDDLVQCNPDAFSGMTTWPCNLGWVVFSDRRVGFSTLEHTFVYAHSRPTEERDAYYAVLTNAFSATPSLESIRQLRDTYNIKALLVTRRDGAFRSAVIKESDAYRVAYQDQDFKVLIKNKGGY